MSYDRRPIAVQVILCVLVVLVFAPISYKFCLATDHITDYKLHSEAAQKFIDTDFKIIHPHFLYAVLLLLLHYVLMLPYDIAGFVLTLIFHAAFALTILHVFKKYLQTFQNDLVRIVLVISLMLVHAIILLYPIDSKPYFGYIGTNVYHNPTIFLLKPFALISMVYGIAAFDSSQLVRRKNYFGAVVTTILSAIAKPNHIIAFMPALVTLGFIRFLRKQFIRYQLVLAIVLSAFIILVVQFAMTYTSGATTEKGGSIIIAPFVVMQHASDWLLLKFLLSIVFPVFVLISSFRRAVRDVSLQLSWLSFAFAAFYFYFLAEGGARLYHGNFGWSAQITLLMLHIFSLIFFLNQQSDKLNDLVRSPKFIFGAMIFGAHVLSGVFYYYTRIWI